MFLVTCFLYFCSYPNHYYVSLYDARADSKNRLELEGISHVVSLVSFPDVSGGGRGGGGGGGMPPGAGRRQEKNSNDNPRAATA